MRNKFLVLLFLSILLVGTISALELNPFANKVYLEKNVESIENDFLKLDFNEKYGSIKLSSTFFWIEGDKVAEYTLTHNTEQCLINCEAQGKAVLYKSGKLFDDVKFKDIGGKNVKLDNQYFIKEIETYEIEIPITEKECSTSLNGTYSCQEVIKGYKKETKQKEVWNAYNGKTLDKGEYEWKLKGKKGSIQAIDFIPVARGTSLDEWAWWNSNWQYRKQINITGEATTIYNFTRYIQVKYNENISSSWEDLRFSDELGNNELPFDFDNKNSTQADVWVLMPTLTTGTNTIYMYYGNTGSGEGNNSATTFINYRHELEFNGGMLNKGSADTFTDENVSASRYYNTTFFKTAVKSDDDDDKGFVSSATILMQGANTEPIVNLYETWIQIDRTNAQAEIIGKGSAGLYVWNDGTLLADETGFIGGATNVNCGSISAGGIYQVIIKTNYTGWHCYLDGVKRNTITPISSSSGTVRLVSRGNVGYDFAGNMSNYRLIYNSTDTLISGDYIKALFQNNNATKIVFGSEETGKGITTTQSYPIDGYNTTINLVNIECNITTVGDENITSVKLNVYDNADNLDYTNTEGSLNLKSYNKTWTTTALTDDIYNWACYTEGTTLTKATANRTFTIDTTSPNVNITYPLSQTYTDDYVYQNNKTIQINWTVLDLSLSSCWLYNGTANNTILCGSNVSYQNITYNTNYKYILYANDTFGNLNQSETNFRWEYGILENSKTYTQPIYETDKTILSINISSGSTLTSGSLNYNGTLYTGVMSSAGNEYNFNKTIYVPLVSTETNKSSYWIFSNATSTINSSFTNQTVKPIQFTLCNTSNNVNYLNFTFLDEATLTSINVSIDTSTFDYYIYQGDSSLAKELLFSNLTDNTGYGFCFNPSFKTINVDASMQYSSTGYPQRRYSENSLILTNSSTIKTLYLLSSTDGTYSTYSVINSVGTQLSDTSVQVERQFSGVWTTIEQGTTGTDGSVTFWLNPDYDHRLTFVKTGYTSYTTTIRPTQTVYTITLGGTSSNVSYTEPLIGLKWFITPSNGLLTSGTFGFNITASLGNMVSCKMDIVNKTATLGTSTGCNAYGGNLTVTFDTTGYERLWGIYYVDMGDGFTILESDAYWYNITSNMSDYTIKSFMERLREMNYFGDENCESGEPCRAEYSRIIAFFVLLMILLCALSYSTGWDFSTGGGLVLILFPVILFASYTGWLRIDMFILNDWWDKYFVVMIAGLFTFGFILNHFGKQ